jgi:oxalate---CoA ligase
VERVAREEPARVALLAPQRVPLDYGSLSELLDSATVQLRERGIESSDRVALVVQNGPEAATAFLALASAAACAPLNPAYRRAEMDFYLDDLKARAVVVSRGLETPAREAAEVRGIAVLELDVDANLPAGVFSLAGEAAAPAVTTPRRADDDLALFLHTSGTTSRPKLVPLSHRNLVASARHVSATLALRPDDRCLNLMPLFHIHGLVAALLASIEAGSSVVCTPGFHPIQAYDWFREFQPTWTTAVPTMYQSLLARWADHGDAMRDHRLRFIRSSSASLPVIVSEELERTFGVPVVEAYGMTEAAHQMASNPLPPARRRPGSVGPPAGPEIAILSAEGDLLPTGSTGEVAIRGESVFAGYEDNPDANAAAFVNGWFRTGDEGSLDEDGYLTLSGRLKEQINRGGEKVSPLEVDARLLAHPAVAEAAAFGMLDARLGEEVAAAVVLKAECDTSEPALQDFVAQTLAPFKVPRRILILDEIPKGPTGKIQRIGLAERLGLPDRHEQEGDHSEPRTDFERSIALIWADVLRIPSVGIHDDFFASGGDSILGAEAVARIREFTGNRDLPLVSIVRAPTVAAMMRELDSSGAILARSGPIALRPDARGSAFFFVHGGDGEVLIFAGLARAFGADRSMYGIRAKGIDDGAAPCTSIEEMAAGYVDAVRSIQQHGPYALGGFCLGATVALEMTHQLVAAGEAISALVLVDPRLPVPGDLRYRLWLAVRLLRPRRLFRAVLSRTLRPRRDPAASRLSEIERQIARMRESYEPKAYLGPASVILSNEHEQYDIPEWHLRRVIRNARTVRLNLDHAPMLQSPGVDTLAAEMRIALGLGVERST